MKRKREIFIDTLKKCRAGILLVGLSLAASGFVFYLYGLPPEGFVYAAILVLFLGGVSIFAFFLRETSKSARREQMLQSASALFELPPADTLAEEDYQKIIDRLRKELTELQNAYAQKHQEEVDYYTAWVHQIKTPIAVMRMELGGSEPDASRALNAELFRIEQYVDMVLQYIRLGNPGSDLLIREYSLDEMIREAIRKYAPQFIAKRLHLDYAGTECRLITDKKWFSCILEQLLSNAIKYTPSGTIRIGLENGVLCVCDTGIGIAPEDVPRIFEKGFTGRNGRTEKRSSGLGLYLCKKAAELLQIRLSVESTVGEGSRFFLDLKEKIR